jgi:hypothetical protein
MMVPIGNHHSLYLFSVGDINLLFVSPQQDNWTAFFGGDPAFCTRVFETRHYSGLFIGGIDLLIPRKYGRRDSWSYMIWKEGVIVDWFVSNLSLYFDMDYWSKRSITRVVFPYLDRLEFEVSGLTQEPSLLSVPDTNYAQAFRGNLLELRNYTLPKVGDKMIKNWLELPAIEALDKSPKVLQIPFSGSAYEIDDIAVYHDVRRGLLSPRPEDNNQDTIYQDAYERSLRLQRIEEFEPVLFNKVSPSALLLPFEGFWF